MVAKLIKIDKNGSKHYEGVVKCDRCDGRGFYAIGVLNGELLLAHPDGGVCYKCGGQGTVLGKWIERTPEYQAKLDAKRKAKMDAEQAKRNEEKLARESKEAEENAIKEAKIKAQKAISQYVGSVGARLEVKCTYQRSASWEQKDYVGYGTTTMYIHTFKDANGNVLVWKTSSPLGYEVKRPIIVNGEDGSKVDSGNFHLEWIPFNYGEPVVLTGTVKEHSEYEGEKQTVLTRCKVKEVI